MKTDPVELAPRLASEIIEAHIQIGKLVKRQAEQLQRPAGAP